MLKQNLMQQEGDSVQLIMPFENKFLKAYHVGVTLEIKNEVNILAVPIFLNQCPPEHSRTDFVTFFLKCIV